jgi:hypothetical protein
VTFIRRGKYRDLWVKHTVVDSNGLELVVLADTLCPKLVKAISKALHVCEYERGRAAGPNQLVENHGLDER